MYTNKYALAVQIEDDLFEIFDIVHFEKGTNRDLKYKNATSAGAKAISIPISNKIKLSDFLNDNNLLFNNLDYYSIEISEDQNIYLLVTNNEVFSFFINNKINYYDKKYQAAFENNVVVIDVSSENDIGLGDLWDRQKFIKMV